MMQKMIVTTLVAVLLAGPALAPARAALYADNLQTLDQILVNDIKQNLRRNNDDYMDKDMPRSANPTNRTTTYKDFVIYVKSNGQKTDRPNIMIINKRDDKNDIRRSNGDVTIGSLPVQPTPRKLKLLFPKKQATTAATEHLEKLEKLDKPVLKMGSPTSQRTGKSAAQVGYMPSADILDMANAKGSRVNAKRFKGRLCDRHVLLSEGPKYDSGGKVYVAAHAGRRSFAQTRSPRLLLPSCCNCCRKSLLGCE